MKTSQKSVQKNRRSLRKDQRGLSLVELLIAMAILAIFSIAVYRAIVVSVSTTAKANLQYKATSMSENAMEGMKATRLDALLEQVYASDVYEEAVAAGESPAAPEITFLSASNRGSGTGIGFFRDNEERGADSKLSSFKKASDTVQAYYLYVQNAKMDDKTLDVLVKLDGTRYSSAASTTEVSASTYNTSTMVAIPDMNSTYDAIFSESLELDSEALKKFQEMREGDDDTAILLSKRDIVVNLSSRNTWGGTMSYEGATYTYQAKGFTEEYKQEFSQSKENLRNVFVFFQPTYGEQFDTITINNPNNLDINVYLVMVDSSKSFFNTANQIKLQVYLNEGTNDSDTAAHASVHTNLPIPDNDTYQPDLTKGNIWFYRGTAADAKSGNPTNFALLNLTGDYSSDVIMDATVYVYQSSEAQKLLGDGKTYGDYTWDQVMGTSGIFTSGNIKNLATMDGTIRN